MDFKADVILPALQWATAKFQEKTPMPQLDTELAIPEDSIFRTFKLVKHTPDLLLKRRGFRILERMADDDQICQSIEAKKTMRLATGYDIVPADDSDEADMHKRFIEFNFEDFIKGSINNDFRDVMGALNLGHSLTEKVHSRIEQGEWAGKIGIKALKSKNPNDWNIHVDEFGNIQKDGIISITAPDIGAEFPSSKFIIYSFRPKYEDVFGTSNYRSLYDLWWLKHIFKRAWGVFGERYGVPVGVAKYPNTWKKAAQDALFALMKSIRTETNVVIPNDVEVEFAESGGKTNDFFDKSIRHINEQITKVILGQTLTSSQGEKGSQSLGTVHLDILTMELDELGIDVADVINEQLIKELIDLNFPGVTQYPKMEFAPVIPEDEVPMVKEFISAKGVGLVKATEEDEKHIRKILQFPERDEDSVLLNDPADLPGALGMPGEEGDENGGGDPDEGSPILPVPPGSPVASPKEGGPASEPQGAGRRAFENIPKTTNTKTPQAGRVAADLILADGIFTGVSRRKATNFEEKMDFEAQLRIIEQDGVEDISIGLEPVLRDSMDRIIREIQRKKIVANRDYNAALAIEIRNKSDMKKVLADGLVRVARKGVTQARKELTNSRKMAKLADLGEFSLAEIKKLLNKNAFRMTGDISGAMQRETTRVLFKAIQNGATEQEAIDGLAAALEPFFVTGAAEVADFTAGRLSTIVRTNVVGSMNTARKEFFLADTSFTPAFQYSAVLDDRVRPNHAAMDARIFRASNPIWQTWTPANGFNCRCLIVPVTKLDGWDGRESTVPNVQPDKGFGKV